MDGSKNIMEQDETYYMQVRNELLPLIPDSAKRILDVGCGAGALGELLLKRGAQSVVGIEQDFEAAHGARLRLTKVIEGNVEEMDFSSHPEAFDAIICADVLEHLVDPWGILKRLTSCLASSGRFIASIPNSRYLALLHLLIEGHWTYQSSGLLDRGHLRFFTLSEIKSMFEKAGLMITALHGNMGPLYSEFKDKPSKQDIRYG
ncbi:MAG: methyltransferase domain-containing protein, partial [bacterium]|nr:methyltransferase domain-containing protein [bacterium]